MSTVSELMSKNLGNSISNVQTWGSILINVKSYGAKGDGSTDDTIAIQKAIDKAQSSGGRIFFPDGTYIISDTLLFDSHQIFEATSKGSVVIVQNGGGIPIFQARSQSTATTFHVYFMNLTLNNIFSGSRPMEVGSMGIDFRETSQGGIFRCRFRYHQYAIRLGDDITGVTGGFYNTLQDNEIASNDYGVYMGTSANATIIEGGRINGNETGIYVGTCGGNRFNTTLERNSNGIEFSSGAFKNTVLGGYFEGNAKYTTGQLEPPPGFSVGDYAPGYGAIVFRSGSKENVVMPCKFTNSTDVVLDFDGRNADFSLGNNNSQGSKTGDGKNKLSNPIMDRDSDSDGLADGWLIDAALPSGTTVALDTVVFESGSQAQRITIAAVGTSKRVFRRDLTGLTPGVPHSLTFVVQSDYNDGWNVKLGNTTASSDYVNVPVKDLNGEWQVISAYFVPTQATAVLYLDQSAEVIGTKDNDANIWIDRYKVEGGMFSSGISNDPPVSGFDAYRSTNQAVSASTFTRVAYETEVFDNASEFDTANGRFTATEDGYYSFNAAVELASIADGSRTILSFYKNGTEYKRVHDEPLGAASISTAAGNLVNVKLKADDFIEVWVFAAAATNVNAGETFSYFSGLKVG